MKHICRRPVKEDLDLVVSFEHTKEKGIIKGVITVVGSTIKFIQQSLSCLLGLVINGYWKKDEFCITIIACTHI